MGLKVSRLSLLGDNVGSDIDSGLEEIGLWLDNVGIQIFINVVLGLLEFEGLKVSGFWLDDNVVTDDVGFKVVIETLGVFVAVKVSGPRLGVNVGSDVVALAVTGLWLLVVMKVSGLLLGVTVGSDVVVVGIELSSEGDVGRKSSLSVNVDGVAVVVTVGYKVVWDTDGLIPASGPITQGMVTPTSATDISLVDPSLALPVPNLSKLNTASVWASVRAVISL
jgi:hypothetical protein